ncbi:hypothetical protein FB45DRAFT_1033043 [Roridomyces roridus]|uniref:Acid protease n=1 Tax=Roridomyces roridus TaxID=1738132 RepID=A0AAD7BGQ0_9AGAR|nr:hypothetical protein FB45DRAFT_1033043 [Roridomyces roridus]
MRLVPLSLLGLAALTAASVTTTTPRRSLNPDESVLKAVANSSESHLADHVYTNARRLALGLPLIKPRRRGTFARSPSTSATPGTPMTCNLRVTSTSPAATQYGYIGAAYNGHGEWGMLQPTQSGALQVSFSYSSATSQMDILAVNGPVDGTISYPYFGAIVGATALGADFSPDSSAFALLVGVQQEPAGPTVAGRNSLAARTIGGTVNPLESAIWTYDPVTQEVVPSWINTNGAAASPTELAYDITDGFFFLTGSVSKVVGDFGIQADRVKFTCVAAPLCGRAITVTGTGGPTGTLPSAPGATGAPESGC